MRNTTLRLVPSLQHAALDTGKMHNPKQISAYEPYMNSSQCRQLAGSSAAPSDRSRRESQIPLLCALQPLRAIHVARINCVLERASVWAQVPNEDSIRLRGSSTGPT